MFIPLAEPKISKKDSEVVAKQISSTFIGPGKTTEVFGDKIALVSNRKFAIPVTSGTVALSLAAKALGLSVGDEIIIPCYGVVSVINAFSYIGLKPKLVDIDIKTGCISPSKLKEAISSKTKAMCFVSFMGNIGSDFDEVISICKENNIPVIEDGAWSLGRNVNGKIAGSLGDISITSFSVPKIISTGQGGAIMTDSEESRNKIIELIDQGDINWRKTNNINSVGSNFRMCDINSALGISQIDDLQNRHKIKSDIYLKINEILDNNLAKANDRNYPVQNIIFVQDRDEVLTSIRNTGIYAAKQYNLYNNLNPYKNLSLNDNFEGGNFWNDNAIYLPFGIGTDISKMEYMANKIMSLGINFI